MKSLHKKILGILDKWFPDEVDQQMYHPGTEGAVNAIENLFGQTLKDLVGEMEKEVVKGTNAYEVRDKQARNQLRSEILKKYDQLKK